MLPKILTDNRNWNVKIRAFRIWQQTPYQVAPLSDEKHSCQSCGTKYQGNYCPRCGQSARVGRFSFKTTFLLFLDIWGMGNRSMLRSMRDLLLRPGYMIRDYLGGCQSAYFPPFKMFFILTTFSLLLSHGLGLNSRSHRSDRSALPTVEVEQKANEDSGQTEKEKVIKMKLSLSTMKTAEKLDRFEDRNPSLFAFLVLVLISAPLYLFVRRCPAVPDLRYSEHLVALVYTSNMYTLYQIIALLTPIGSELIKLAAVIMIFVALRQFTGYTKRRLLGYIILTMLIFLLAVIVIATLAVGITYYFHS